MHSWGNDPSSHQGAERCLPHATEPEPSGQKSGANIDADQGRDGPAPHPPQRKTPPWGRCAGGTYHPGHQTRRPDESGGPQIAVPRFDGEDLGSDLSLAGLGQTWDDEDGVHQRQECADD